MVDNEKNQDMKICTMCGIETIVLELPSLVFNYLDGRPRICERCVARSLGLERNWVPAVAEDLKRD